jgi:hypothetical protein
MVINLLIPLTRRLLVRRYANSHTWPDYNAFLLDFKILSGKIVQGIIKTDSDIWMLDG